jgi:hypothetical protein
MNIMRMLVSRSAASAASGLALWLLSTAPVQAACSGAGTTWTCTAGSTVAQVQTAVNSATDGAVISFEAGAYSWGNGIALSNTKGVTLKGAGTDTTVVTVTGAPLIYMDSLSGDNSRRYRITGFRFQNAPANLILWFYGPGTMSNLRIDNNTFADFATGAIAIFLGATNTPGRFSAVVDHNKFSGANNFMSLKYLGPGDPASWPSALRGTAQNVFVENNTYQFTNASDLGSGCVDVWAAGAMVFRYNDVTNCLVAAHGVSHGSTVNFELYGNTLRRTSGSGSWVDGTREFHHQGSGEILAWNNTFVAAGTLSSAALSITHYRSATPADAGYGTDLGRCDGSRPIDGNAAPVSSNYGYPCWMQPGRAPAGGSPVYGTLSPIYAWMNVAKATGSKVGISIDNPWGATAPSVDDHIKANRDYYDAVSASAQTSPTSPFNGTSGMGFGTLANRPTTCTTNSAETGGGVGYWATDTQTLYRCATTNGWIPHYKPYAYPHPLTQGDIKKPMPPTDVKTTL